MPIILVGLVHSFPMDLQIAGKRGDIVNDGEVSTKLHERDTNLAEELNIVRDLLYTGIHRRKMAYPQLFLPLSLGLLGQEKEIGFTLQV